MENIIRSICQNLVSNDRNVRRRAIKSVLELFKKTNTIDDLSLHKLCKGLYYSLWMTDDPIQVHKISVDIIQLYKSFRSNPKDKNSTQNSEVDEDEVDIRLRYIKSLMETVSKEWPLLDKNRVDKVLLFTRILVSEILYYMNQLRWDLSVLNKLSEVYMGVFSADNLGLWLHFIQVYLNELVMNYNHLQEATTNGVSKKNSSNTSINKPKNSDMDGLQLLYILKPFVMMFVTNKDKLLLTTIYNYVFKELHKLNDITDITVVVWLLNMLLNPSSTPQETEPSNDTSDAVAVSDYSISDINDDHRLNDKHCSGRVQGLNKKYIKNTLKQYGSILKNELTPNEKIHLEHMVYSLFPDRTEEEGYYEDDDEEDEGYDEDIEPQNGHDMSLNSDDSNGNYISLADFSIRRMTKKRLRNLFLLNNTKRYLIIIKATDDKSTKFMNKLMKPKVRNQLFFYSLIRLKRLKLQYRFKHCQLNKIYNFNKETKSKFNVNLQQALDNIRNARPLKSSLAKTSKSAESSTLTSSKKNKKKNVVFNLQINQVTAIPSRRKKIQPFSLLVSLNGLSSQHFL
ncbi:hypothetical protein MACJ_003075 [Theileria orientalis]|uniref:Uncharacterized protein n=1 Tax=Theileria orientalis TaxID=68886 RepID=A0A976QT67_THEOR|nr:hypothetical protein MACJ_003075 [Theileria orientalis]